MRLMRAVVLAVAMMAGGCSPYLYKQELQAFDTRADALASAIDQANIATEVDYRRRITVEQQIAQATGTVGRRIKLQQACVDFGDRAKQIRNKAIAEKEFACRLVTVDPVTGQESAPLVSPLERSFQTAGKLGQTLDEYTKALLAITDAEDRKALDAAAGNLCEAVVALSSIAGTAVGAPFIGAAGGPVCGLMTNAYGAYFDHRRYEVLRAGVINANEQVMPGLTAYMAALLQQARADRIASIMYVADAAGLSLNDAARAARAGDTGGPIYSAAYWVPMNALFTSAEELERLMILDPTAVVTAFAKVHNDLARTIDSGERETEAVFNSLTALGQQIQALRNAFQPVDA